MATCNRARPFTVLHSPPLTDPAAWPTPAEVAHLRDAPLPPCRTRRPLPLPEEEAVWGECEVPDFRALVTAGGEG